MMIVAKAAPAASTAAASALTTEYSRLLPNAGPRLALSQAWDMLSNSPKSVGSQCGLPE